MTTLSTTSLEELRKKVEELDDKLDEAFHNTNNWEEYLAVTKPIYEERKPLARILHMNETDYTLIDFPKDVDGNVIGDLIPVDEFWKCCEYSAFVDSDGEGYYATETQESDIPAIPSEIVAGFVRKDFKYVVWYNK